MRIGPAHVRRIAATFCVEETTNELEEAILPFKLTRLPSSWFCWLSAQSILLPRYGFIHDQKRSALNSCIMSVALFHSILPRH